MHVATDDPTFEPKDEAGKKGAGKSRRRPPPTLDLAATEVKAARATSTTPAAEPTPGPASASGAAHAPVTSDMDAMPGEAAATPDEGTAGAGEAGMAAGTGAKAAEADASETSAANTKISDSTISDSAETEAAEATASGEAPDSDAGDTEPVGPAEPGGEGVPPASPAPRRQLGLFGVAVAALVSGVVGGAVAFTVASTLYGTEQSLDSLTDLEARALDLRQRVEAIEGREGAAPAGGNAAPADLAARLTALENGLDALGTKVEEQTSAAPAAPAATPEEVTALGERLDTLEGRVNAIPAPARTVSPEALSAATARIDSLEQKLSAVSAAQQARGHGPSQIIALDALREAVLAGRPFTTELKVAQALLGPQSTALETLAPMAATGYPSGPHLAAEMKAAATPPPAQDSAPAAATDDGMLDRLVKSAQNLVSVRHAEEAPPALDEAEAALARGDYERALTLAEALPADTRARIQTVIATVEARQTALGILMGMKQSILGTLGGDAQ